MGPSAKDSSLNIAPACVEDYRKLARKRLPRQFFDYIDGHAYQEKTGHNNVKAFEDLQLRQRILQDVSRVDTSTSFLGRDMDMPVILAPVGLTGCFAKRGEVQGLKAANKANVPFTLSTVGICSIEELQQAATQPFWFQLYVIKDRQYCIRLLERAKTAGCDTLVFTVDLPVLGERYRDTRNGLSGNSSLLGNLKRAWDIISHPKWVLDVPVGGKPLTFGNLQEALPDAQGLNDFKGWVDDQFDPSISWQDLDWIRDHWKGNIVLKGILDVEDAKQAAAIGADAIVVSNHGGRQLDGVPATLSALPDIAQAVQGKTKIIVDSGIRSGLDVVKALASGADACMIGRAWSYALAARGEQGVSHVLEIMKNEMRVAMSLIGVNSISELNSSVLINPSER
jgi:L-lactate dehydrogenase (cytochrome)